MRGGWPRRKARSVRLARLVAGAIALLAALILYGLVTHHDGRGSDRLSAARPAVAPPPPTTPPTTLPEASTTVAPTTAPPTTGPPTTRPPPPAAPAPSAPAPPVRPTTPTSAARVARLCGFDPGATVEVAVNGRSAGTDRADSHGCVSAQRGAARP